MIINGTFVKEEDEISKETLNLFEKNQFKDLFNQLRGIMPFEQKELKVESLYKFDAQDIPKENAEQLLSGKMISLRVRNKIEIVNVFAENKDNDMKYDEFIVRINKDDRDVSYLFGDKGLHQIAINDTKKQNLEENDYTGEIDNPDFKPFSTITPKVSFCLAGYKHCGPGCGDGLKYGGGEPTNFLDACCRGHDRCWRNFGNWDPCCDANLVACAALAPDSPIAKNWVMATFAANALRCPFQ